jgi:hypothetical protein
LQGILTVTPLDGDVGRDELLDMFGAKQFDGAKHLLVILIVKPLDGGVGVDREDKMERCISCTRVPICERAEIFASIRIE